MGPKNCEAEDLVLYTADGQRIGTIRDLRYLPEVTVPTGKERGAAMRRIMSSLSLTISAKPERDWRCRGRKRFIKLLMSKGISRNEAESVARVTRIAGVQYRELWQTWFFWKRGGKGGAFR